MIQSIMKGEKEEESDQAKLNKWAFDISGPVYLTYVDWRRPDHIRSVLACLVQGVYILERDRQQRRTGDKALSPPWWNFFQFQCIKTLVDRIDYSIFGAIFEYKPHAPYYHQGVPPRYIIVFRGTIIEPETRTRDLYLDMQLPLNGLTQDSRYHIAFQEIHTILSSVGPRNVLLAGHSLGAAIALQVGKELAKMGCLVESYLFNPPCTYPIEKADNPYSKSKRHIAKNIVNAGLHLFKKGSRDYDMTQQHDPIHSLCSWVPNLFVNPKDPICREYIGYFEQRDKMKEWRSEKVVDHIATKNSLTTMLSGAFGRESDPLHLIPSALLTKNMIPMEQSFKQAHGVEQWWKPHSYWHSKLYIYRQHY